MSLAALASVDSSVNGNAVGSITVAVAQVSPDAGDTRLLIAFEAVMLPGVPIAASMNKNTNTEPSTKARWFELWIKLSFVFMAKYSEIYLHAAGRT